MRWPLAFVLMLATPAVQASLPGAAQGDASTASVSSSDPWIDAQLADVERYGARYGASFDDELVRYQDAPRELLAELRTAGWTHAQIYAACAIAKTSGRPCRVVADAWNSDRTLRWDAVASKFGIAAGSTALQRLHDGIVATYGRWGRPAQPARPR